MTNNYGSPCGSSSCRSSWFNDGSWWLGCKSFAPFHAVDCTLSCAGLHRLDCREKGRKSCGVRDPCGIDAVLRRSTTAAAGVTHRQEPRGSAHRSHMHLDRAFALARLAGHVLNAGPDAGAVIMSMVGIGESRKQLAAANRVVFPDEAHDPDAHRRRRLLSLLSPIEVEPPPSISAAICSVRNSTRRPILTFV